jgi:hypothetical protein
LIEIAKKTFVFGKTGDKRECCQRNEEANDDQYYAKSFFRIHNMHTIPQATLKKTVTAENGSAAMLHNSLTTGKVRYTMEKAGGQ